MHRQNIRLNRGKKYCLYNLNELYAGGIFIDVSAVVVVVDLLVLVLD